MLKLIMHVAQYPIEPDSPVDDIDEWYQPW
jgi:hypothetical protein